MLLSAVGLLSIAIALTAYGTHLFGGLEGGSVDLRFTIRGDQPPTGKIVIVAVDAKTFQDLDLQWPFPRAVHARLIDRIARQHPAAIAYDVQFSEASDHGQRDDLALLEAIQNTHGRIVLSTTETERNGNFRFLGSSEGRKLLKEVGAQGAIGLFPFDTDGVIRQFDASADGLRSLPLATADIAEHRTLTPPSETGGEWIDFRGPAGTYPVVSFSDVLRGHVPRHFFRGKVVVVGATAPSLQDIHATSTDNDMAGPEIQANAIDTALRGWPLQSFPGWLNVLVIIGMGLAAPVASLRIRPWRAVAGLVALAVTFVVGEQLAFDAGAVGSFVYPLSALALGGTGSLAVQLVTEAFERVRVRDLFARFVPEDVVDEVLASADGLRLGGIQVEGTVMFTDIRGFTTLSEELAPATVIKFLNRYLTEMSDAILDHRGTLTAYLGDGIMAVFGAPIPQDDHADRALAAAREMLDVRLPRFNAWLREQQIHDGIRMGIGLNSGSIMTGHVGSERRVEYTAIGDATNTASRIEGLCKEHAPHMLLFAESTKGSLRNPPSDLQFVAESPIRGRSASIRLWTVSHQPVDPPPS